MSGLIAGIYNGVLALATQLTNAVDSINNNTNTARDNIKANDDANRESIKAHVTAQVATVSVQAIKSVQTVAGTTSAGTSGSGGLGGAYYRDLPISAVNTSKAVILPTQITAGTSTNYIVYRFLSATVVRAELFGTATGFNGAFSVLEFY